MVLNQQLPSFWGNRYLLADLYVFILQGLLEYKNKGNMYLQLITDLLRLDENRNVIILHFLQYLLS